MKITEFSAENFRNLKPLSFYPGENVNVIFGQNAQGKTNLIEGLWLFSGAASFRGAKESEMIGFGQEAAKLSLRFADGAREHEASLSLGKAKKITLNRVPLKSRSGFTGRFYCVVFSPSHLSLVQEGPKQRRKFLDNAVAQIKPDYLRYLSQYERVLEQRNAVLRDVARFPQGESLLDVWDNQLAKLGTIITFFRRDYIEKLSRFAVEIYAGMAGNRNNDYSHCETAEKTEESRENFFVSYVSTAFAGQMPENKYTDEAISLYYNAIKESLGQDMKTGVTSVGVHRDDMEILIGGRPARVYGSQGQQRSAAITLKLAEAAMLRFITKEDPVVLLDDVMSELDLTRQDYILNHIKNHQVFLTCCELHEGLSTKNSRVFHMENGVLTEKT